MCGSRKINVTKDSVLCDFAFDGIKDPSKVIPSSVSQKLSMCQLYGSHPFCQWHQKFLLV